MVYQPISAHYIADVRRLYQNVRSVVRPGGYYWVEHWNPFQMIGIERGRASRRWRVTVLALSVCKAGSQFHRSHVSRGPPIIPDGRISQVRFEVLACRP